MASDWQELTLREAGIELIDCDHRTPPAVETGFPYIAIPQLKDGRIDLNGVRRISAEHFADWTRKLKPRANDVIVVRRCNSGDSAVVPDGLECAIGQNLVVLRSANGALVAPRYLRWLVRGPEWWSEVSTYINVGAVFDSLRCRDIPNFRVRVPSHSEQGAISELLESLDDRIHLFHQSNATLEGIASAIFRSWFVDFDPVRAKIEGRNPEGINSVTAALFPSEIEDSRLGPIPKSWRVSNVGSIAELIKGCSYKGVGLSDSEGAHMFNLGCFNAKRVFATENIKRYTGSYRERQEVVEGDLIMANTDMTQQREILGRALFVPAGRVPGFVSHHVFKVAVTRENKDRWTRFLFFTFQQSAFRERAVGHATGTTVLALARDSAEHCPIIEPPEPVLAAFDELVAPVLAKIASNLDQARNLSMIRDALLPRMVSGRLRFPGAKAAIEDAAL